MGLSEDGDGSKSIHQKFEEICLDLNMDTAAKQEAWINYNKMKSIYTLEGEQIHWLACALYESCRRISTPTVGSGTMEGNCVSLTRLLRSSKLSLIQFFNKMRKWSDMSNLPKSFRDKIDKLERNFAVSTVIFKKFEPIFSDIFVNTAQSHDAPRQARGRKQRRSPCTSQEVFNFAWTLFIQVKGNFPAISDDLVNSYHLLLCCIDWIFANALLGGRKDLLKKDFEGLPSDFLSVNFRPGEEAPCIMQLLCEVHDGLVVEAKTIKEHWWKPFVKKLFDKKTLKGKVDNLSAVLELGNFEENVKMINNLYEEYVLGVGDFDERIFLGDDAQEEIGTPGSQQNASSSDLSDQMAKRSIKQQFDETKTLTPSTPLTGRRYLKEKDASVTPVTTATQSVSRLQNMLSGCKTSPSTALTTLFQNCDKNPSQEITQRVQEMGQIFCKHYAKLTEYPAASTDFARKRLHLGESLYFKTLEAIAEGEKQRLSAADNKDWKTHLQILLENDSFHRSLFACCLEIVIFSYNSQRTFPWIVDIFEFSSYQFYKVIEIIIRAEKGLSRDVVKHLNHIEESILESYAWKSDSPLWDAIKENSVPTCEEVTPVSHMEGWRTGSGPPVKKKLRSLVGTIKPVTQKPAELLSPGGGTAVVSAADRFSSPTPGNAKRRLFGVGPAAAVAVANSTTTSTFTTSAPSPAPGTSSTQVPATNGLTTVVPPTPPPGVSIISTPSQLPSGTLFASSAANSSSTTSSTGQASSRSILLNQLKGGTSYSVVVPNKVANCLAPSSMLPKSNSPPPIITTTTAVDVTDAATLTSVPFSNETIESSSSSSATTTITTTGDNSSNNSQNKSSSSGNQQAIVAVMEDGRQILIPVQIETPTVSSASSTAATAASATSSSTASNTSVSNTLPSSPGSTTTTVSIKRPGQGYYQVQVKLDRSLDIDLSYKKPKKTGSLSLFFRKVYHLASVRLRDLFDKLGIEDDALMKKIWTCFEYGLVQHAGSLMCDRHLDQLIMCSIYLIARVTEKPQTFQNIMKCYRLQPQAHSHVYRSVLLSSRHRHSSGSSDGETRTSSPDAADSTAADRVKDDRKKQLTVRSSSTLPHPQPNSQPPTPTKFLGQAENVNLEDERGDLIQFYNLVYLKKIRNFAMKFTEKSTDLTDQPKLSPLPAGRSTTLSPRRVSSNHSLFISPAQGQGAPSSLHNRSLSYSINKSPAKELQAINKMIRQGAALVHAHGGPQLQQGGIKSAKRMLEVDQEEDTVHSPATKHRILAVSAGSGGVLQQPVLHPLIRRLQEMDQH